MLKVLLILNVACSGLMAGVIWVIQLVHYPLFVHVVEAEWREFHRQHTRRITWLVAPAMLGELLASAWLVTLLPTSALAWSGLALVVTVFAVTAFVQVPLHARLSRARDASTIARLVRSNWPRTALWSARFAVSIALFLRHAPTAYLATTTSGARPYDGTAINSTSTGSNASAADGLIVLSDFNGNGNETVDANGDEVEDFYDAKLVGLAQGKSVNNLQDQLDFMVTGKKLINSQVIVGGTQYTTTNMISLVDVEMTDDGVIDNADFDLVQAKVLGDFNWSGGVDNQDIAGFVQALTDPAAYEAQFEEMDASDLFILGDYGGDNLFNNQDVAGFISVLTGNRPMAEWFSDPEFAPLLTLVPEPSSVVLLGLAGLAIVRRRRVS